MRSFLFILLLINFCSSSAQNIGIGTTTPNASSKLEISSTTSGLLIPRMTSVQRTGIASPSTSLLVYDTDSSSFVYYSGGWLFLKGAANNANNWSTVGNINTTSNNFIGTADNNSLRIRVNNRPAGVIDAAGKNIGLGDSSLYHNTGYSNIAIGPGALLKNTDRNDLVAIGDSALYNNGIGVSIPAHATGNTAVGSKALYSNTTGYYNTANGSEALYSNTIGRFNTACGFGAMNWNVSGILNTATGYSTLISNTTGNDNTGHGAMALFSNSTGYNNTANGSNALYFNSTGYSNTANGKDAMILNTTGFFNTAIGTNALYTNNTGYSNTATGVDALYFNTDGHDNTAAGLHALKSNTTGYYNTGNGVDALYYNTTGFLNTANGGSALVANTTGYNNTAIGFGSLYSNLTGYSNTAIGGSALFLNIDRSNLVAVGDSALFNVGASVGFAGEGYYNTAVGSKTLFNTMAGRDNTAMGYRALFLNITGNNNTALGSGAGTSSGFFNNTISIGNSTYLNGASNQAFIGGTGTIWNGGNVAWSTFSDARIKTNINEDVKGLAFINLLHPVTYYRSIQLMAQITGDKEAADYPEKYAIEKIKFSGFLAQEVEQAAKESGYDFNGITVPKNSKQLYSLSYETFVVPLVKAVQEQQVLIERLQKQVEADKAEIPMQIGKQQIIIEEQNKKIDILLKEIQMIKEKLK